MRESAELLDGHAHVFDQQVNLREVDGAWTVKDQLPESWPSYAYQERVNRPGDPAEEIVDLQAGLLA